jgi:hypothetical protein
MGTVYLDSGAGIRDYAVILSVDGKASYSFRLVMSGFGSVPLFSCRGFLINEERFITIDRPPRPLTAPHMFEYVVHKIVESHDINHR